MTRQKRLGRGLEALLESRHRDAATPADSVSENTAPIETAIEHLQSGRYQPRRHLSEDNLAELAASIREQGVLQPLVVRPVQPEPGGAGPERYEIVAGERRWRAAKIAGLSSIPVLVRDLDDQSALAVALIENLQREDLNPIDQARSLARLAEEFALTHEQVAKAVGRSRASVSNLLRLLDLQDDVKDLLAKGSIDMGHARAMLPLDPKRQVSLARKAETKGLSVRQVEEAVRNLLGADAAGASARPGVDMQTRWLQQQIAQELGEKLAIRARKDGGYTLNVAFGDLAQLQAALQRIQDLIERIRTAAGPRVRDANR
jgi:ParB family transcriptional regulator, chromosome partitioning protein